jgi:hypothetical protein
MNFPKFDWKNIDWLSAKPSKERIIIGIAVILVGAGLFALGRWSSPSAQPTTAANGAAGGAGSVSSSPAPQGGDMAKAGNDLVPLQPVQSGPCKTFAPQGWHVIDANPQGTAFTVASADSSQMASYGAVGVNGGAAAGYYGEQFRSPENLVLFAVGGMTNEQAQASGAEGSFGYYQVLNFATASRRGYALIYRFQIPADPQGYGVIMRIAVGNDPHSVAVAGSVAAATRCASQLVPPPASPERPSTSSDTHDTGKSDDDDVTMAGTYNAQLGTGWVHDSLGDNYNVDVAADYHETGPDGPGYYKRNGNDLIKLQNGLSE